MRTPLWLRWSVRDLRGRWLLVIAIALVIATGSGTFAALGSTSVWRRMSNDDSYAATNMHDLRIELSPGTFAAQGSLEGAVRGVPHAEWISAVEERLAVPVQVDASGASPAHEPILVRGSLVGVAVETGRPAVDSIHTEAGRALGAGDDGRAVVVIEYKFARHYDLPPAGEIALTGGRRVAYVGQGMFPEHFMVVGDQGDLLAEGNLAILFAPLSSVQESEGLPGRVNDLVLRVRPGTDVSLLRREILAALPTAAPDVSAQVLVRNDNPAYRMLYDDIETDQQFWYVIAMIILASGAFAAFNLTTRIVEAQRREIGIGMALGVSRLRLALRPVLTGCEVALLGAAAGVGLGLLIDEGLRGIYESFLPLPVWRTPFQPARFAQGAALGFVLPVAATLLPVWRAVRVDPVQSIRAGHLSPTGGLVGVTTRLRLPGRSYDHMAIRNVFRTPRRTFLTALGIGAAITTLIGILGMLDSFVATVDNGERELTKVAETRLDLTLDRLYRSDGPELAAVASTPGVSAVEPGLRMPGQLSHEGATIDALVDHIDFVGAAWTPTLSPPSLSPAGIGDGIVLAEGAADDLGVGPGDTVTLRHPRRTGPASFEMATFELEVAGTHPNPMRFMTYLDRGSDARFGFNGAANIATVHREPGASEVDVRRSLFGLSGVSSAQPVDATARTFRDLVDEFTSLLRFVAVIVLGMALLIAFNSTRITVDERRREHATMFAFGLPIRTVLRMTTMESLLTGFMGTAIGLVAGFGLVRWLVFGLTPNTMPEFSLTLHVSGGTVGLAIALGMVAVAVAPLFTLRRMRRMPIADALRIVE